MVAEIVAKGGNAIAVGTALGRAGLPDDVALPAVFLASKEDR